MNAREIRKLGYPDGPVLHDAQRMCGKLAGKGLDKDEMRDILRQVADDPDGYTNHGTLGDLARDLVEWRERGPRDEPVDYEVWGEGIDPNALQQMENACRLPVATRGAVMPDAHLGYGLPVGGVLETEGAIIPGAVGVDISCRMRLSITDIDARDLDVFRDELRSALEGETAFGMGADFDESERRDHPVMSDDDWSALDVSKQNRQRLKDKAWRQLGSSGSGNHFAEWGIVEGYNGAAGKVALLTHSGSRGPGAHISNHFAEIAEERHPELPDDMRKLSWLELDSEAGQAYLQAMRLMGRYANACHETIHDNVTAAAGAQIVDVVENKHNFAWTSTDDGTTKVVHRKGATPAHTGEEGIIPGTMTDPAYIVRGKGDPLSVQSAAHGAGRTMSRNEAKETLTDADTEAELDRAGVELLSAGLDESPHAYKDIGQVMADQQGLVETIGKFYPRIVKMAPPEEPFWRDDA